MKKILLALAILPLAVQAQVTEISFNAGPSLNIPVHPAPLDVEEPAFSYAFNLNFRHTNDEGWVYGLLAEFTRLRSTIPLTLTDTLGNPLLTDMFTSNLGKRSFGIHLLAGYSTADSTNPLAVGISVGLMMNNNPPLQYYYPPVDTNDFYNYNLNFPDNAGPALGVFVDYTHYFNNKLGVAFTLHPKIYFSSYNALRFRMITMPATVGLRVWL